ncbi:MAG: hypothetical protein ACLU38_15835 [Dysosmobacter sp.]
MADGDGHRRRRPWRRSSSGQRQYAKRQLTWLRRQSGHPLDTMGKRAQFSVGSPKCDRFSHRRRRMHEGGGRSDMPIVRTQT